MDSSTVDIVPFELSHQPGIDLLFQSIQNEYSEQVFTDPSNTITFLSAQHNRAYWVALCNGKVIGTVGIILFSNKCCGLKSMFLAKEFRNDRREIAKLLLQTAIDKARTLGSAIMYLGTMSQFKPAQRFYEKNGFVQVAESELPGDFVANEVDTVFYKKPL